MSSNVQANITMQRTHSVPVQFCCPSQHTPPTTPSIAHDQNAEARDYNRRLFEVQRALQGSSQFVAEQDAIIKGQDRQLIDAVAAKNSAVDENQKEWEDFYRQKKTAWDNKERSLEIARQDADTRALTYDRALKDAQEGHKQALANVEEQHKKEVGGVKRKADEELESERKKLRAFSLTIKHTLDEKSSIEQELAKERKQHTDGRKKWEGDVCDLQQRIDKVEEDEKQVQEHYTETRKTLLDEQQKLRELKKTLVDLKQQLSTKDTAYNELKSEHQSLDERFKNLEASHKDLQKSCEGLTTKCKNHNEDREAAVKLCQAKHKELKQEKNLRVKAEQNLQSAENAQQLAEQHRAMAERELSTATTKLETKERALERGRDAYTRQQTEITKLRREAASLAQERLNDEQAARKELEEMQADLAASKLKVKELTYGERAAKQELQDVKGTLETSQGELRGMKRAAEGYKATLLKLGENMNLAAMLQGLAPDQKWSLPQKLKLWEGGRRRSK